MPHLSKPEIHEDQTAQAVASDATCSALRFMVIERDEAIDNLCRALDDLLPQHMMACCAQGSDGHFLLDEFGMGIITEDSCKCEYGIKSYRKLLGQHRNSRKALPCVSAEKDEPNTQIADR